MRTVSWSCRAIRCSYGIPGGKRFNDRFTSSTTWWYSGWLCSSSSVGTRSRLATSTPASCGHKIRRNSSFTRPKLLRANLRSSLRGIRLSGLCANNSSILIRLFRSSSVSGPIVECIFVILLFNKYNCTMTCCIYCAYIFQKREGEDRFLVRQYCSLWTILVAVILSVVCSCE